MKKLPHVVIDGQKIFKLLWNGSCWFHLDLLSRTTRLTCIAFQAVFYIAIKDDINLFHINKQSINIRSKNILTIVRKGFGIAYWKHMHYSSTIQYFHIYSWFM